MHGRDVVVIGASVASIGALQQLLASLPAGLPASVLVAVHVLALPRARLWDALTRRGRLPVAYAVSGQRLTHGLVTIVPPDQQMVITTGDLLRLTDSRVHPAHPAIDPLMTSAARVCGDRVIAVLLDGPVPQGANCAAVVAAAGGAVLVRDPSDARDPGIPRATLDLVPQATVWRSSRLGAAVANLVNSPAQPYARTTASWETRPIEGISEALELAIIRLREDSAHQRRLRQQLKPDSPFIPQMETRATQSLRAAEIIAAHVLPRFRSSAALAARRIPAYPPHIRRVVDAIEAHPEQGYTAAILAGMAGVSERSLQKSFMQHLEMSPMAYIRQVRLAMVHEDLSRADPAAVTVTEVARRWGFAHLGRFSAAYRARYGVPPSHTVRTR